MKANRILLLLLLTLTGGTARAQLTVEECYRRVRENYPLIKKYDLLAKSNGYDLSNASKAYLPQVSLTAKATYQTDVTQIPISLPGIEIPTLNKDQYAAVIEVSQNIWDGGATSARKKSIEAQFKVEKGQYEVDMYALRSRINDLFFGILLIDRQLELNATYRYELDENLKKINSWIENGVANRTDADVIRVELHSTSQQRTGLETQRKAYETMLAYFIGEEPTRKIELVRPHVPVTLLRDYLNTPWLFRPETSYFAANIDYLETQRQSISAANRPKLSAFVQGAYGNPGLNMFKDEFAFYAIGGVRLSWNFGGLYTKKNDLKKITSNIDQMHIQREIFNFNTQLNAIRQQAEIDKYFKILEDDSKITQLRSAITRTSWGKAERGVMSTNDCVRDMAAEQTAFHNRAIHEIELIKALYDMKYIVNE